MTEPPVWLLDVDGVINGHPRFAGWGRPPVKTSPGPVYYEPQLIDRIRSLHQSGTVEVRWATTWCGYPIQLKQLGEAFDLDLVSAFGDRPMSKTWAEMKVDAALSVLTDGRRLVWTDDSEVDAGRRLYPKIAAAEADGRALLIEPVSQRGLQPEHVDQIEEFAAKGLEA